MAETRCYRAGVLTDQAFSLDDVDEVTGFYGQNLPYPGFSHTSGFITATVLIVVLSSALCIAFRRNNWL